jgi:hydrogenase nickel incorporation protein HypB
MTEHVHPALTEGYAGQAEHEHGHTHVVGEKVLDLNDRLAGENSRFFADRGILALNFLSSPGSGKTSLLEKLIAAVKDEIKVAVIEGDQQTTFDAARIRRHTDNVVQLNTNRGCHLDAHMVHHAMDKLDIQDVDLLLIENVGNLVCPSMFDLGEAAKVVILSVTEGDDKPLKYPNAFFESRLAIISKTDLLPYVDFDMARCKDYIGRINPEMPIVEYSSKTEEGLREIVSWLTTELRRAQPADTVSP